MIGSVIPYTKAIKPRVLNVANELIKFLNKSADTRDLDILQEWIRKPENQELFKDYVHTHFAIELAMNEPEKEQIKERLLQEIRKEKSIRHRFRKSRILKYAAIAVLFLGVGYFLSSGLFKRPDSVIPNDDDITLQLENGAIEIVSENGSSTVTDASGRIIAVQKGDTLIYNETKPSKAPVYSTLYVPFGKQFALKLSDGTQVFLNSGTSLKFPIAFVPGEKRAVFLDGEAYFDVTHDESRPFTIQSESLQVEVLGTSFNLSNYPEETETEVVLLDGLVSLSTPNDSTRTTLLDPGFKADYDKVDHEISIKKVNPESYIAWMNGSVVFRNETFGNIILKLERMYNVEIFNSNEALAKETFTATLETNNDTIEDVLGYFNKVHRIEYTIIDNKIIIN